MHPDLLEQVRLIIAGGTGGTPESVKAEMLRVTVVPDENQAGVVEPSWNPELGEHAYAQISLWK